MKLIRTTSPRVLEFIGPKLDGDSDYSPQQELEDFGQFMVQNPDLCYVGCLFDEEQSPLKLCGCFVGFAPPHRSHLFLIQAWLEEWTQTTEWPRKLFDDLQSFARDRGLVEIRGETRRNPEAILRRWGFETLSTVVSFKLEY
jgi:hypothetical protein